MPNDTACPMLLNAAPTIVEVQRVASIALEDDRLVNWNFTPMNVVPLMLRVVRIVYRPRDARLRNEMAKSHPAKSHPIDVLIGRRLRQRRSLLGMSQTALGAAMGVTFQQVQKYERGANRIGATQLFEVSRVLDIPISFFFEDAGALSFKSRERKAGSPANDRETLHLVRDFFRIRDRQVRLSVAKMVKAIAQSAPLVGRTLSRQDTGQADIVIPGVGIVPLDEALWSKVRTAGISGPSPAATNDEP